MGVETVTTRRYKCNYIDDDGGICEAKQDFIDDVYAGRQGWALGSINAKEFALCPNHYINMRRRLNL